MFSRLRRHFGTAGLVVSVIALVAALAGGAYAASGGLTGKQKKEVKAIAKSFQGTGPAGPQGAPGSPGAKGDPGTKGTDGTDGQSVTTAAASGGECPSGGIKVTSASGNTKVCNGQTGFTETLPSGKTETGSWSFGTTPGAGAFYVPVTLAIPLAAPLAGESHVHFINEAGKEVVGGGLTEQTSTECLGTAAAPTATPGSLCIYTALQSEFKATSAEIYGSGTAAEVGVSTSGAVMTLAAAGTGALGFGTFAMTAP
jgi:hypothetical protein